MAFSTQQRLMSLAVPTPLAKELGRQIDAGSYNVYRLIEMGMDSGLAKIVVTAPFDRLKAVQLGMPPAVAAFLADGVIEMQAFMSALDWNQTSFPLTPRKVNGTWVSGFDPDAYLPASYFPNTLWVNNVTGNNANPGTEGSPVKAIWRAEDLAIASGIRTRINVVYTGTDYARADWFSSGATAVTVPMWIASSGGQVCAYNGDVLAWPASPDVTYPNCYKFARSSVSRVIKKDAVNAYGMNPDYAKFATVAELNASAPVDGWAQNGSDLYVRRVDGSAVTNSNTRALLSTNGLRTSTSLRLTGFDIEGGGGSGGCLSILNVVDGVVIVEDCTLRYPGSDSIPRDCSLVDTSTGLFAYLDTDFSSSSKDGVNATRASDGLRKTFVLTERCSGVDFGRGASTSNNAITGHQMTVHLDVDNQGYRYGRGGTVRFIEDSRLGMLGGSVRFDLGDGSGFTPSIIRADDTAESQVVDTVVESAGANTLLTSGSGVIFAHNVEQIGGVASGNVRFF